MKELNERTALNRRLQEDAEATERRAQEARVRKLVRAVNRVYRKSVTVVAIDAALIGASLAGCIAAVACVVL